MDRGRVREVGKLRAGPGTLWDDNQLAGNHGELDGLQIPDSSGASIPAAQGSPPIYAIWVFVDSHLKLEPSRAPA